MAEKVKKGYVEDGSAEDAAPPKTRTVTKPMAAATAAKPPAEPPQRPDETTFALPSAWARQAEPFRGRRPAPTLRLERIEPNATLLKAVLRTEHLMNPEVRRLARRIVEEVVRQLMEKLATEIRQAFSGTRSRHPSQRSRANDFDFRRTIRDNLRHYRPDERRLYVERAHFHARTRRQVDQWQLVLVVDQSGSMMGSVIHSAVTAACLWGLPGIRTHLVAFDTNVVDLTADVDDPVELLMKVQLGDGTDIAEAMTYAAQLVDQPRRAIVALVTDFFEGGDPYRLVRTVKGLVEQGTHVLGLAALDEEANPIYDRDLAQRLADVGAHVGSMTPGQLADFLAQTIGRG